MFTFIVILNTYYSNKIPFFKPKARNRQDNHVYFFFNHYDDAILNITVKDNLKETNKNQMNCSQCATILTGQL